MGCASSCITESSEPLTPEQLEVLEREAFEQLDPAPGWAPGVTPQAEFMSIVCQLPISQNTFSLAAKAQLGQIHQAIVADTTAGSSFRIKSFVLPLYISYGKYGTTVQPCDFHQGAAHPQLLFEKSSDGPLETVIQRVSLELGKNFGAQGFMYSFKSTESAAFVKLYAELNRLGAQGYSLSAIIEDPITLFRETGWGCESCSIDLVCQRPVGVEAAPPKVYHSVNVPIEPVRQGTACSSMPTLTQRLDEWYGVRGCKLASVYTPPHNGSTSAPAPCHLIFEEAPDGPFKWLVVDSTYNSRGMYSAKVDHSPYLRVVRNAVAKGWQFAGLIKLQDQLALEGRWFQGEGDFRSSVKLIFQCKIKATPSAPVVVQGTVIAPAEVTSTLIVPSKA